MPNYHAIRLVLAVGVLLFAGAVALLASGSMKARAYHYHSPPIHIWSMHEYSSATHEEFCVHTDGSLDQPTALARVKGALWVDGTREWDGLASSKVWFIPYSGSCPTLANRASIEIEYYVSAGGCGGVSCANLTDPYFGPLWHNEYKYAYVTLKTSHMTSGSALYHDVVNHETGHVLGFKDPNYGDCPLSVMHSRYYGCASDLEWPSDGDIWVGTTIANNSAPY